MSQDSLPAGQIQLYSKVVPDLGAGQHEIRVTQKVWEDDSERSDEQLLQLSDTFRVNVVGPKYRLGPRDVLGVFPAANAKEASNLRVPHIALSRRTLPWERTHSGDSQAPWMALLLIQITGTDSSGNPQLEYGTFVRGHVFGSGTPTEGKSDALEISRSNFDKLAPAADEMKLLTHVRRVSLMDTEGEFAGDDDGFVAIVIGNRLPDPGLDWLAVLVSVEELTASGTQTLPVLYHWKYHTAPLGGDFQAWAQALAYNGGVHLLGQIPDEREREREPRMDGIGGVEFDHRERDGAPEAGLYHGPLLAVPMERSEEVILTADRARKIAAGKYDVSYAAAFELGRMLAMSKRGILQALIEYRRRQYEAKFENLLLPKVKPLMDIPKEVLLHDLDELMSRLNGDWVMGKILSKGDLVTDPLGNFDSFVSLFGGDDLTGLTQQLAHLQGLQSSHLEGIGLEGFAEAAGFPSAGQQLPGPGRGTFDLGFELGMASEVVLAGGAAMDRAISELEAFHEPLIIGNEHSKND